MVREKKGAQPKRVKIRTADNAGVLVVGTSARHGSVPAVLLGGRFYTGRRSYDFSDFGGGLEPGEEQEPYLGAFREFCEELFGMHGGEAEASARRLWDSASDQLVGGAPIVHRSYALYIVPAEAVVAGLELGRPSETDSAIDMLLNLGKRNEELTSLALVSVEALLSAGMGNGVMPPLCLRSLDGVLRAEDAISLRPVMVGPEGSIAKIDPALRSCLDWGGGAAAAAAPQPGAPAATEARSAVAPRGAVITRRWAKCGKAAAASGPAAPPRAPQAGASRAAEEDGVLEGERPPEEQAPDTEHQLLQAEPVGDPGGAGRARAPYVFDMETGDPDDVLTLLFLAAHPAVELRAVTITPGSEEQVSLVRWLLNHVGLDDVRLGAEMWPANAKKERLLQGHFYRSFGRQLEGRPICEPADQVLAECCDEHVTLVTGAPLHNLGAALERPGFRLGRWVAQRGFAGEGVVPPELQMPKFAGKRVCPTWNFGGNAPAARAALASPCIRQRVCVSKNVCHAAVYDAAWHGAVQRAATEASARPGTRSKALQLVFQAMDDYLKRKPEGKALHDPLALAVALDDSVCTLAEVELFHEKAGWGSTFAAGTDTWISVSHDPEKFRAVVLHS